MRLLLCSSDQSVLDRWSTPLAGQYELMEAASVREINTQCTANTVHLLLLHRALVNMSTTGEMLRAAPDRKIFLLSDRPDEDEGLAFLRQGIVGYANTYIAAPRLIEAIRVITSGSVWVGQKVMQRLIRETLPKKIEEVPAAPPQLAALTAREWEIAAMVATGLSNPEIAAKLNISQRTVKAHLGSVYAKTGTNGRLNLALLLNRRGNQG